MLDHLAQEVEQLAQKEGPVAESCLILSPTHIYQLFRSLDKWTRVRQLNGEYVAPTIGRRGLVIVSLFFGHRRGHMQ